MSSETNFTPAPDGNPPGPQGVAPASPAGLPPVSPPSGKLMMQLFLVPGLLVAVLVVCWLVCSGLLFPHSTNKKDILEKLNDPNAEIRWRAAEQLAQALPLDAALRTDGDFARQLGLMLEKARDDSRPAEKAYT